MSTPKTLTLAEAKKALAAVWPLYKKYGDGLYAQTHKCDNPMRFHVVACARAYAIAMTDELADVRLSGTSPNEALSQYHLEGTYNGVTVIVCLTEEQYKYTRFGQAEAAKAQAPVPVTAEPVPA